MLQDRNRDVVVYNVGRVTNNFERVSGKSAFYLANDVLLRHLSHLLYQKVHQHHARMKSSSLIPFLAVLLIISERASAQIEGTWIYTKPLEEIQPSPMFPDGSFWIRLEEQQFVLANSNDRNIFRNADLWTYIEGQYLVANGTLKLKIEKRYFFDTNIGRRVREFEGSEIKHQEIELSLSFDPIGNLLLQPSAFFPFGCLNGYTLSRAHKMPYYPVGR